MLQKKYLFIGNRFPVLQAMLERGIQPEIFAPPASYLANTLEQMQRSFNTFENKEQLVTAIRGAEFDIVVSNGCPYILPVSSLCKHGQIFVNVHPSCLPDLKGMHPVNGALLFNRPAGAACHVMDDGIDTGPIIARAEIPLTDDVDLGLLYQLTFMAEQEVFMAALDRQFMPDSSLAQSGELLTYKRQEKDRIIDFSEDSAAIVNRIRAFGIASQSAYFIAHGEIFQVLEAQIVTNPFMLGRIDAYADRAIAFLYENTVVLRKGPAFLKLKGVTGDLSKLAIGKML